MEDFDPEKDYFIYKYEIEEEGRVRVLWGYPYSSYDGFVDLEWRDGEWEKIDSGYLDTDY